MYLSEREKLKNGPTLVLEKVSAGTGMLLIGTVLITMPYVSQGS